MKIRLVGLTKDYHSLRGVVTAVSAVSLEVPDKSFFVLLGPSGCGKSTVLNLIAGLETPTSGEIWFDDRVVSRPKQILLPPKERHIGMVFQSYALYPHLDVFENIAFPLRLQGVSTDGLSRAVNEVAEALGIAGLLRVKPGELSGGERQRVAIGRAIVRQPEILLFDEPLSNLDAKLRLGTRIELKKLQQRIGKTVVYVTHDQVEAMTLGDRVALMKDGRIEQIGTARGLYEKPANAFVAAFIGSPPMNLIRAGLKREGDAISLMINGQAIPVPNAARTPLAAHGRWEVLFGIRPEHIAFTREGGLLRGTVAATEMLGHESICHVDVGGHRLVVLTAEREPNAGESVGLTLDMEQTHFFDPEGSGRIF